MQVRGALATIWFLIVLLTGQPNLAVAQQVVDLNAYVDDLQSLDEVDQRTPLKTTQGFMRFAELGDYETAAEYLDLRYLPEEAAAADGEQLAEQLYVIISRGMRVDFGDLSDQPEGSDADGLPAYRDLLGKLETAQGGIPLYLQLIPGPKDTQIWKISNATVAQIPRLYEDFGYSPLVESVRLFLPAGSFLGVESFKWVMALLAGLIAAGAWLAVAWLIAGLVTRRHPENEMRVRSFLTRPIPVLIFVLAGANVLRSLGLGVTASRILEGGTIVTLAAVWLLFSIINLSRDLYAQFLQARRRESALMVLRPVTTTAKVIVALMAIVIWLDNIGVNVTALVAGLGVGGLAVALVLQKPLEDIMGAITLYTQQPVTVGQFCTCGDVTGTVEEINLRTTRIRTLANTVVVIPNSAFATANIENVTERQRILHRQTVRLALITPGSTIRNVLEQLREMLQSIEKVTEDAYRVRLIGFGEFSIDVEVFAHVATTDWSEFLKIAEDINLGTIGVLESTGARLAEPPR